MIKKLACALLIMFLSMSFISCSNQNKNNNKEVGQSTIVSNNQDTFESKQDTQSQKTVENNNKLTLDDIKANYTGGEKGQVVNITTYSQYALVEYTNGADLRCYDWYNLKTGDKDALPIQPYNAKLERIKNENDILFTTDGVITLNGHKYFPEIIECYRGKEVADYDGDFYRTMHSIYLKITQGFDMGVKSNEAIADIKVSLKGVEVLFQPMKGEEAMFYADYTTVPPTKTSYDKSKNQFIVEFKNTYINKAYDKPKISEQNRYINSVDIERDGSNTVLVINLKDTAKYYTIDFSHLEPTIDDFPYLDFNFANEYKIE